MCLSVHFWLLDVRPFEDDRAPSISQHIRLHDSTVRYAHLLPTIFIFGTSWGSINRVNIVTPQISVLKLFEFVI